MGGMRRVAGLMRVFKAAGADVHESWNYFHLSASVHLGLVHTKGWVDMLDTYPHLMPKFNAARERLGMKPLRAPTDLYGDIADEEEPPSPGGEGELVNKVFGQRPEGEE